MNSAVTETKINNRVLIGCGILKKEINWLMQNNDWLFDTVFLDSALHINFDKLQKSLTAKLARHSCHSPVVFYGACHPLMDTILQDAHTIRTEGQNCVEILLGHELFLQELSNGAYFLLEDWAMRWPYILSKTFGDKIEVTREIFKEDRKYILAVRTPCSGDFIKEAESAAQSVDLPLKWLDVDLHNLKSVLISAMQQQNDHYHGR